MNDVSDEDVFLRGIGEALSHDIRSLTGTIGRKFRVLESKLSPKNSTPPFAKIKTKSLKKSAEFSVDKLNDVYTSSQKIRDNILENKNYKRSEILSDIQELILKPISDVQSRISMLTRELSEHEEALEVAAQLRVSATRLQKVIRPIVESLAGEDEFTLTNTNLVRHVRYAKEGLEAEFNHAQAVLLVYGRGSVVADQGLILTLFQNIFDNSIKYQSSEPPEISVEIQSVTINHLQDVLPNFFENKRTPTEWVRIDVSDNGRGIADDELEEVFELGFRADMKDEVDGTGFGLARVKDIVRKHRGRVFFNEAIESGSRLTIVLPSDPRLAD